MNLSDELLTINETCKLLKISRPTLLRLIKSGEIKGLRQGLIGGAIVTETEGSCRYVKKISET